LRRFSARGGRIHALLDVGNIAQKVALCAALQTRQGYFSVSRTSITVHFLWVMTQGGQKVFFFSSGSATPWVAVFCFGTPPKISVSILFGKT
jgi:hypothetical protein